MTQPPDPQLTIVQDTLMKLGENVKDLTRAIQGDVATGSISIRESIRQQEERHKTEMKSLKDEFKTQSDASDDRIEILENKFSAQENMLRGVLMVTRWLGVGSLASLLGLIAVLSGLFGGHK
ncbi:hypothetical protein MF271_16775 [Deinococcus sp. KNUC1210]|uniref:hypothetical protein n=1 Tax=Deinococcus sp. KNUC1210 TaxID=2917691 RepID=UPI001EF11AC6|nr:hypothetical protein [Deinococcus sp. KNUC1210]ULH15541.1 hypothetical protein MF271_16775 [Deinococcus sp. KNUC1210]